MADQTQLDRIESTISDIKVILTGNSKPERGLIIRVDRLEQIQRRGVWFIRLVIGAVVVAVAYAVVLTFGGVV